MEILFVDDVWDDYLYWQQNDKAILKKVTAQLKEITGTPYTGTGKPELLCEILCGFYSGHIKHEHRLVYQVDSDTVAIVPCRYHY